MSSSSSTSSLKDGMAVSTADGKDDDDSSSSTLAFQGPRAMITESNGEISCSVEETNRIRKLLGMKPLNDNKNEKRALDNFNKAREDERKTLETATLMASIEAARNKRVIHGSLSGKTLGDTSAPGDEALVSAADWVQRSRAIKKVTTSSGGSGGDLSDPDRRKPETISNSSNRLKLADREEAYSSYSTSDMKGIQVMHDLSKSVEEGSRVVLTLADSSILESDEVSGKLIGVNKGADVLENSLLVDEERRKEIEKRKKKLKQPLYMAYDDDEFDTSKTEIGVKRGILSHYDKEEKAKPVLVFNDAGSLSNVNDSSKLGASAGGDGDTSKGSRNMIEESLRTEAKLGNDFMTQSEFAEANPFKKARLKNSCHSKRGNIRTRNEDDDEEDGGHFKTSSLELEDDSNTNNRDSDRGSRNKSSASSSSSTASSRPQLLAAADDAKRKETYANALKIAQDKTERTFAADRLMFPQNRDNSSNNNNNSSSSNNMLVASSGTNSTGVAVADRGALFAMTNIENLKKQQQQQLSSEAAPVSRSANGAFGTDDIDQEGRRADGRLVFTDTTQFSARLQAIVSEKSREKAEARVRENEKFESLETQNVIMDSSSNSNGNDNSDNNENRIEDENRNAWREEGEDVGGAGKNDSSDDMSEEETDEQLGFLHNQHNASSSIAATLSLLRASGDMSKKAVVYGRANDSKVSNGGQDEGFDYKDKQGRALSQKQKFRELCYSFHGIKPSKKTKEKRDKAMESQMKTMSKGSSESSTMKSLIRAQEATGNAFVTVQGATFNQNATSDLAKQLLAKKREKEEREKNKSK